jgi:replicative DNA helicase
MPLADELHDDDDIFASTPAKPKVDAALRVVPHNVDVEQALLGTILVNNAALQYLDDRLQPEHFYEPIHRLIFTTIKTFYDRGNISSYTTLKHYFSTIGDVHLPTPNYLEELAIAAAIVIDVREYSEILYDLYLKRELIRLGEDIVNTAYKPDIHMPAMLQIGEAESELYKLAEFGDAKSDFQPFRVSGAKAVQMAERAFKRKGDVVGVSTGLRDLDDLLGGLQDSDLVILAGRPSMGKTALATTIAYKAALHFQRLAEEAKQSASSTPDELMEKSVGFFSLEMSAEQLATRILSARASVNSAGIMRGDLTDSEFEQLIEANKELTELPFFVDDTPALSISAVRTRARRLKRVSNLGLIIVDYLQLLVGSSKGNNVNRVQEVSEITQGLKALAKELNIPVLALSQLSRQVEAREDKRPQLSDLRESGSIEQDADVVMFVFREEYYVSRAKPDEDSPKFDEWQQAMERVYGKADVIVAKQRHGPIGTRTLQFFGDQARFDDLAKGEYLPERRG